MFEEKNQIPDKIPSQNSEKRSDKLELPPVTNRLEFLALCGIQMSNIHNLEELFQFLAKSIRKITAKGIVVVTMFYQNTDWEIVAIEGISSISKSIAEIAGIKLFGAKGKIVPNYSDFNEKGVLKKLPIGFHQLTKGVLSKAISEKVFNLAGVKEVYSIPFFKNAEMFGSLSLVELKDTPPIDKELIEAFILQFSAFYERLCLEKQKDLSEEKFRTLFDAANVGVSVSTTDGQILEVNQVGCEIIDAVKEEVLQLRVKDLYYNDKDRLKLISMIAKQGEVDNFPVRFISTKNQIKWINLSLKPIEIDGQECYLSTLVDITKVKETEIALRESEKELRKYIDESPLPIAIVTRQGKLEYLNTRFVRTFGYHLEEIENLDNWWKIAYADVDARKRAIDRWGEIIHKDLAPSDSYINCKNGDRKFVEIYTTVVGEKIIAMFSDITEKNRLEIENKNYRDNLEGLVKNRTSELEEKNRELERMNNLFVGREFRIKELKDKIEMLEARLAKKE